VSGTAVVAAIAFWIGRLPDHSKGPGAADLHLYFYPVYEAVYGRMAAGRLPTWNPFQLCGIPWLATLQGGFFYPSHALYLVLPLHVALAASHAIHVGLATLFTMAFARGAGLGPAAAILAAMLFVLRGMFASAFAQPNYLEATTWLPLALLGVLDVAERRFRRGAAIVATAVGMSWLAGYPQPTTYMIYTLPTLLATVLLADRAAVRRWAACLAVLGGAVALGTLAAAIQFFPAAELVRESVHRDLSPGARGTFLLPGAAILVYYAIAGASFSWGATPLALAAIAPFNARRRALAWWAVGMSILTVLVALGDRTPIFHLYRALPFLDSFRFPDRALGVTDFVLAVAAGLGLDALAAAAGARKRTAAAVALAAVVGLVVASRWWGAHGAAQAPIVAGGLVTGLLLAWAMAGGAERHGAVLAAALVLTVAVQAQLAPWRQATTYSPEVQQAYATFAADYRALNARAGHDRAWISLGILRMKPERATKLASRYGVRTIDDYEPLPPRRQAEYFTYLTEGSIELQRPPWLFNGQLSMLAAPRDVRPTATRRRLLDLAAVRWIAVPGPLPSWPDLEAFVRDAGFQRSTPSGWMPVFENPHALPRAYVTYRTRPAPEPAALLARISDDGFDPLAESFVEGDPGLGAADDAPRGVPATIEVDDERVVEVEATLERPGLVVLADAYYPGWQATVDGGAASILPTNHLFRGVVAPAGTHRVRFEYAPASLRAGMIGSAFGWLGIALLGLRRRSN
jgi:hypothetical protein